MTWAAAFAHLTDDVFSAPIFWLVAMFMLAKAIAWAIYMARYVDEQQPVDLIGPQRN